MADHAKFIASERKLVDQAREFSHDFDQLLFQAVDLSSMRPQSQTQPISLQFLNQNRLIEQCKIKSIIHPLLADHVFREANRFLEIIEMFEHTLTGEQIVIS
jgi:hypothetical protein